MAKTKPINPEKQPSVKERLTNIENIDNLLLQSSDTPAEAAPT